MSASLIETIDSQILYVHRRDLDVKVLTQDTQLDAATPRVFTSDPFTISCRFFLEHSGCVELWVRLNRLCNNAAELSHAVEGGTKDRGRQGTKHAAVVVGHDTEDQLAVKIGYGNHWWIRIQGIMLLAGEIERLVRTLGRKSPAWCFGGLVCVPGRVETAGGWFSLARGLDSAACRFMGTIVSCSPFNGISRLDNLVAASMLVVSRGLGG